LRTGCGGEYLELEGGITGSWRKLHSEELHNSPNNIRPKVMKSGIMR
jgi:hypothetical protein